MSRIREAAEKLIQALSVCHTCSAELIPHGNGYTYCEDSCSADCEEHDEPNCPEDLDSLVRNLRGALADKQPGLETDAAELKAWRDIAMYNVKIDASRTCIDYDPAGSTYDHEPNKDEMELWSKVGVTRDDLGFTIGCSMPSYFYIKPEKAQAIRDGGMKL